MAETIDQSRAARAEWWTRLWQDIRHATRTFVARPALTVVILVTLALGIGANTAIVTVVDATILRPFPYPDGHRLVHLWEASADDRHEASYPDFLDWRREGAVFADMAGYQVNALALTGRTTPQLLPVTWVTPSFFEVLGVRPTIGRVFSEAQDRIGDRVVVLSHGLWQREFSGDTTILGRAITLGGVPYAVVGVLRSDFHFARSPGSDVWLVTDLSQPYMRERGSHWLNVIARLNPGVTPARARAAMTSIGSAIAEQHPENHRGKTVSVITLRDELVGHIRPLLLVLLGAVVIVLLVACANVAGLLTARATARQHEMAIRSALGASRARIVQQLLTESVLLAVVGALLGLVVAQLGVRALVGALPEPQRLSMPYLLDLGVDLRVLGYAIAVAGVTGLLFGLVPAIPVSRPQAGAAISTGTRATRRRWAVRHVFVVGEIALTAMLLTGAGLLTQSLVRLLRVDPGFRSERVVTSGMLLPEGTYRDSTSVVAFFDRLLARLRAVPGIADAGITSRLPLHFGNSLAYTVAGQPQPASGDRPTASVRQASPGYFRTMGIAVREGRDFGVEDGFNAPRVVIVNRTLAAKHFGPRPAVGARLTFGQTGAGPAYAIVGVVDDVPIGQLDERPTPTIYFAHRQLAENGMFLVVRARADPAAIVPPLRAVVRELDPNLPLAQISTMERAIAQSQSVFMRRYAMQLVAGFAALALVLSVIGLYGLISYHVAQRTRELGVRMALGARPATIVRMVVGEGAALAVTGVAIGLPAAAWAMRYLDTLLFGVGSHDPATYSTVGGVLVLVGLAASYLPALRATQIDPVVALGTAE